MSSARRVEVETEVEDESIEAGESSYFFRPLRPISEQGKLEGLRVRCGPSGSEKTGEEEEEEEEDRSYGDDLPGRARSLALSHRRGLLFALSPDLAGFWTYGIQNIIETYQEGSCIEKQQVKGTYTKIENLMTATALSVNSDESLLCVTCAQKLLFFSLAGLDAGTASEETIGPELLKEIEVFEQQNLKHFEWSSAGGSSNFVVVSGKGDMKVVAEKTYTVEEECIECAAWSPDDACIAYGSKRILTVVKSNFEQAFEVELSHSDYKTQINSIVWLSSDTMLVMCMSEGCDDADQEELAVCFSVKITSDESNDFSKAEVRKIDEDSICIALDEEGAPLGSGPYLHHCSIPDWKTTIVANRKSVGDCSINIMALDSASATYNVVEVLQNGFDDADSLRPAIPLRTDKDEGDDFLVGLQMFPGKNKIRVKDPMKEAYVELDRSFPIAFAQTLSSKIFLFSFAGMSEDLPSTCSDSAVPNNSSVESFCERIDSLKSEQTSNLEDETGKSPENDGKQINWAAIQQRSLPDDDTDESESDVDESTQAAIQQRSLPDDDTDESESDVDESTQAAIQQSLPDDDTDESESDVDESTQAAIQQSLPDDDTEEDDETEEEEEDIRSKQGSLAAISSATKVKEAFGKSAPSFGASVPSFGASVPSFGASVPSFGASVPSFGASVPSFGASASSFGASASSFGASAPSSGASASSFGASASSFGASVPSFGIQNAPSKPFDPSAFANTFSNQNKAVATSQPTKGVNIPAVKSLNLSGLGHQKKEPTSEKDTSISDGLTKAAPASKSLLPSGFGKGMPPKADVAKIEPTLKKPEKKSVKKVEMQSPLLTKLQDSFIETLLEARSMQEKLASSLKGEDCSALASLPERMKKSMVTSTEISKLKMELEQSRGTAETLIQKLKALEKQAQTYSTPRMEADSLHSIANASIGSKRHIMRNSLSSLQETVNDITEFLNKNDMNKYRIPLQSQAAPKQKSVRSIYSTINAQSTLARNQNLRLDYLREKVDELKRERSSQKFSKLSIGVGDMGVSSLTGKFGELMPADDGEFAQLPSSPWQVKERDFILSSIVNSLQKASASTENEGPRITRVKVARRDQPSEVKKIETKPILALNGSSTFAKSIPAPNTLSFGQSNQENKLMGAFMKKEEVKPATAKAAPAKSASAPMPPMPSFGQLKVAKDTMSSFMEKEEVKPAKPAAAPSNSGSASMPPMPSFGQLKAAKETMSSFMKKEEVKPATAKAAPAKSGSAPMPPMPSFGQLKAAKDTMSTFMKKEEAQPAKEKTSPSQPAAAPTPPILSSPASAFGQLNVAKDTTSAFMKKEEAQPAKVTTAPTQSAMPSSPMPSFGQLNVAKEKAAPVAPAVSSTPQVSPFAQSQSSFGQPAFGQSAFAQPAFGQSAFSPTSASSQPAFGQSAFGQMGGTSQPAFGQSAFGKIASSQPGFGAATSAFGGATQSAFGQSAFGGASGSQPAFGQSAFGQMGASQPAFGQSSFGQFSPSVGQSPFSQQNTQPQSAGFGGNAFGAVPTTSANFTAKIKSNPGAWQPRR